MKCIISFDPGDTIGYSIWGDLGGPNGWEQLDFGQVSDTEFGTWWANAICPKIDKDGIEFEHMIIEEYRIFKQKARAHVGSRLKTSQCIGKLKLAAELKGIPVVEQPADKFGLGLKYLGLNMPRNHAESHQFSAMGHAGYFLFSKGLIKSALQIQKEKENASNYH